MAHILVIDDEELARFTVREILEGAGHTVSDACDGNLGLALLKSENIDLVVTDIIMPNKEGVETIMETRRDFPALPIIAISGGGRTRNRDFLKLAEQYGANHTLTKPFSENELLDLVRACL